MAEYTKEWLPLRRQVSRLVERGLEVDDLERAEALLRSIGYYRVTGYLYPFLESEEYVDEKDRPRIRVLNFDEAERYEVAVTNSPGSVEVDPHTVRIEGVPGGVVWELLETYVTGATRALR